MKTIVLQGDSITDANRNPQFPESSGNGYATMVKGWLGCEYPGQYHCYNRGIAGNRIGDLYARIREDIINLKPDIVSILIGVNKKPLSRYNRNFCHIYKCPIGKNVKRF